MIIGLLKQRNVLRYLVENREGNEIRQKCEVGIEMNELITMAVFNFFRRITSHDLGHLTFAIVWSFRAFPASADRKGVSR
jgi:hypothetical protein